jgi:hypothetical protein
MYKLNPNACSILIVGGIASSCRFTFTHEDVEATRLGGCLLKVRHVSLRYLGIALRAASSKALIALA